MITSLFTAAALIACTGEPATGEPPADGASRSASSDVPPVLVYTQAVDGEIEPCG